MNPIINISQDIKKEIKIDAEGKGYISIRGAARVCDVSQAAIQKHISIRESAKVCGVDNSSLGENLKSSSLMKNPSKLCKILITKGFNPADFSKTGVPIEALKTIVNYYYNKGKYTKKGCELISMPFEKGKRNNRSIESKIQENLARKLKGVREVKTPAGLIDILTDTEIIEVKNINDWKGAIGQILVYGFYYPKHTKRIHLFGKPDSTKIKMIKKHLERFDINMSFQKI